MFDMGGIYLLLGMFLLAGLLVVGAYLLHSFALWRMAKNAAMAYSILSWVPFAKYYVLGSLCDRSIAFRTGRRWHLAAILPILNLLTPSIFQIMFWEYLLPDSTFLYSYTGYGLQQLSRLVFLAVSTAGLYYLYSDYAPAQAVLYTILSFFFSFIAPAIFLMLLYKQVPLSAGGQPPLYAPPSGSFTTGWGGQPPQGPWTTGPGQPYPPPRQPPERQYYNPPVGLNRLPLDQDAPYSPGNDPSGKNGPEL